MVGRSSWRPRRARAPARLARAGKNRAARSAGARARWRWRRWALIAPRSPLARPRPSHHLVLLLFHTLPRSRSFFASHGSLYLQAPLGPLRQEGDACVPLTSLTGRARRERDKPTAPSLAAAPSARLRARRAQRKNTFGLAPLARRASPRRDRSTGQAGTRLIELEARSLWPDGSKGKGSRQGLEKGGRAGQGRAAAARPRRASDGLNGPSTASRPAVSAPASVRIGQVPIPPLGMARYLVVQEEPGRAPVGGSVGSRRAAPPPRRPLGPVAWLARVVVLSEL
jgi:hypothetical protein